MRWLGSRAVAIVGSTVLCAAGCLTSQEAPADGGGIEDPPITINGGSGGANSQGGDAGEATGGTGRGGGAGTSSSGDGDCDDDSDCEFRPDDRSKCHAPSGDCVDCLTPSDCDSSEQCVDNECRPIGCVSATDCAESETCVSNTCRERCTTDSHCLPSGQRCNVGPNYCVDCLGDSDCDASRNCQQGVCVRDICVEGTTSCETGGLVTCNANGSDLGYPVACATRETCLEDSEGARCEPWVCTPGYEGCSTAMGERVVRCSDDGLTEMELQDCADTMQLCIGGACTDAVCEPSARFCAGNTVQQCDTTGMSFYLYQTCTTNQYCNPATTTCAVRLCTPNQPACNGNVYTTCNEDGFGYTGTGTDCSTTGQFCGPMGCTTSAVDTIPASPTLLASSLSNYVMMNVYSVTGDRNLLLIEQYMNPTTAQTLTWHVYESVTQTGTYTSISSTTTTSTPGEGYQASGALNVPLVAGRFYAIGVSWTTPGLLMSYMTGTTPQMTSFGEHISMIYQSTSSPPASIPYSAPSGYVVAQRLTTTAP